MKKKERKKESTSRLQSCMMRMMVLDGGGSRRHLTFLEHSQLELLPKVESLNKAKSSKFRYQTATFNGFTRWKFLSEILYPTNIGKG